MSSTSFFKHNKLFLVLFSLTLRRGPCVSGSSRGGHAPVFLCRTPSTPCPNGTGGVVLSPPWLQEKPHDLGQSESEQLGQGLSHDPVVASESQIDLFL